MGKENIGVKQNSSMKELTGVMIKTSRGRKPKKVDSNIVDIKSVRKGRKSKSEKPKIEIFSKPYPDIKSKEELLNFLKFAFTGGLKTPRDIMTHYDGTMGMIISFLHMCVRKCSPKEVSEYCGITEKELKQRSLDTGILFYFTSDEEKYLFDNHDKVEISELAKYVGVPEYIIVYWGIQHRISFERTRKCSCGNYFKSVTYLKCPKCSTGVRRKETGKTKGSLSTYHYCDEIELLRFPTIDTEWLICLWYSEGESLKDISLILARPLYVVTDILQRCIRTGAYKQHILVNGK